MGGDSGKQQAHKKCGLGGVCGEEEEEKVV